ncbi:MAG TPA: HoxN/HupN/NixA family nickel/cobalt transporter [Gaiellaceae bacterium]|nr:HoxN/HupN/NixA family nickel/cobalt transporter [Gaiellaceae bacterium]
MPWRRATALGSAILALHVAGIGLLAYYAGAAPSLVGLGALAYTFGLRHAFDADHIAAIDNTTRKLLADDPEQKPLAVGFFFSLGHSSVVFALATGLGLATASVKAKIPSFQHWGGIVGTGVSGTFLMAIGVLNLLVLVDIVGIFRGMRRETLDEARLEERLMDRGLMSRGILRRIGDRIHASWQMYPLGFLFGLGFDTATEVGLLALSAGAAGRHLPFLAVIALPLLFAAGMSLLDTIDGAFMSHAYGWAFSSPVRKVYYNITVTALSVTVALGIGGLELVQLVAQRTWLGLNDAGYLVVGLFVATWAASIVIWKTRRVEERWSH